jgi:hypothetical protein
MRIVLRVFRSATALLVLVALTAPAGRAFACDSGTHGHEPATEHTMPGVTEQPHHDHGESCHAVEGCLEGCITADVAPTLHVDTNVGDRTPHDLQPHAPPVDPNGRLQVPDAPPPRS